MYLDNTIPLVPYTSTAPVPYISEDLIFDLWKSLYLSSNGPNFIFSPYCVISALMMLLLGSTGHTQLQLARALFGQGFNGTLLNQHVAQFDKWNREFLDETWDKVHIGNFIYSQQGFKPNYTQTIAKLVKANATLVDFANPKRTIERINWDMSRVTNGTVSHFLSKPEDNNNTTLLLLNTLYFDSRWAVEFNPNSTDTAGTFWISPNKSVKAAMMYHRSVMRDDELRQGYSYYRNRESGLEAAKIPYSGGEYSLVIILPPENVTVSSYIRDQFNAATFNTILANFHTYAFWQLIIPRFKLSLKHNLKSTLHALGITDTFESDSANFSEMFQKNGLRSAVVSEIMQSAEIEFHETGTRPVESGWYDYTVDPVDTAPPFAEFIANRPFLFAIVLEQSEGVKQFLFAGVVGDPTV